MWKRGEGRERVFDARAAPVKVDLNNVFARVRVRRGEEESKGLVDGLLREGIADVAQRRPSRFERQRGLLKRDVRNRDHPGELQDTRMSEGSTEGRSRERTTL